jgi:ribonucleoside-diphosphate reductase alpha chain
VGEIVVRRHFTKPGERAADSVAWRECEVTITDESGAAVFAQRGVEVPAGWSDTAASIVASKYFRGHVGTVERERSVRQLVERVVRQIGDAGGLGGYFATADDRESFEQELTHLLLNQMLSFNSPVWFNVGVRDQAGALVPQQASACFINSVEDTMESIMDLAAIEAMLFKGGSGAGCNLSTLRSSRERLSSGGLASGPVSFMRGFDSFAGVIRSGGRTRRAAKMVILNADHPDIFEFVRCKAVEERKAHALIAAGFDGRFNQAGGAYD